MFRPFLGRLPWSQTHQFGVTNRWERSSPPPPTSSRPSSERGLNLPWVPMEGVGMAFGLGTFNKHVVFLREPGENSHTHTQITNHKQNHQKNHPREATHPFSWHEDPEIPLKCEAAARMQQCQHQDDMIFFQLGKSSHWNPSLATGILGGEVISMPCKPPSKFLRKKTQKSTKLHPSATHPPPKITTTDRLIGTFLFCKQCSIQITIQLSQIAKDSQCSGLSEGLKANLRRQRAALP